jgi:hypothetical protein
MDGSRFAVWTRRRLAVLAGGGAIAVLERAGMRTTEAKKKHNGKNKKKRKRCAKLGAACNSGKKGTCCGEASCEFFNGASTCCVGANKSCASSAECCNKICFQGACVIR